MSARSTRSCLSTSIRRRPLAGELGEQRLSPARTYRCRARRSAARCWPGDRRRTGACSARCAAFARRSGEVPGLDAMRVRHGFEPAGVTALAPAEGDAASQSVAGGAAGSQASSRASRDSARGYPQCTHEVQLAVFGIDFHVVVGKIAGPQRGVGYRGRVPRVPDLGLPHDALAVGFLIARLRGRRVRATSTSSR